jgi:hypothetical protein
MIDGWMMDGCVDGWKDLRTDEQMIDGWIDDECMDGCTDGQTDRSMDKLMNGWMVR